MWGVFQELVKVVIYAGVNVNIWYDKLLNMLVDGCMVLANLSFDHVKLLSIEHE